VTENPIRPLDELKTLGLETACSVLWLREQAVSHKSKALGFNLTLGSLGCSECYEPVFTSPRNCMECNRQISVDDDEALSIYRNSVPLHRCAIPGRAKLEFIVTSGSLRCRNCGDQPIPNQTYSCPSCGSGVSYANFRLLPSASHPKAHANTTVDQVFKDEITNYESWDQ
jgi:Zn finger protein HypA/HybF involved in hydrogenase expression